MTVLLALVLIFLIIKPDLVMSYVEGAGIRLLGGGIASMGILGPVIAIVSGYSFLYSLEPRGRSAFFLLVGMAATFATQARGAEIALLLVLALLVFQWTTKNRRSLHLLLAACMAFILLAGAFAATIGADQIWKKFNRGLDTESFLTASGRTIYWRDVIVYSVSHPQGMGYIAGIRRQHFGIYAGVLQADLNGVGGTDNSYMQALSDAGWLSLGVYLILLGKTLSFGWRFARKKARDIDADERRVWHALRCAILMFLYCLVAQMDGSNFVTPLHQEYYTQNILIMLILGASSEMLFRERFRISLQSSRF
jgi:O-antigen ligase